MPAPTSRSIKANELVPKNGTVSKRPLAAPRQILRVLAFSGQSSWTPEANAGIVFGILMFLLGVLALWQTRSRKLGFVGDIESHVRLFTVPCAHIIRTDPALWVPPYEPPRDFLCIADPPDSYANTDDRVLGKPEPKKPAPKPKPVPKPPQPRDGYGVHIDLIDTLPPVKSYHGWVLGGQEPKKPAPKPQPAPKPPQPRDGYGVEMDMTDVLRNVKSDHGWALGGQEPNRPATAPKPKPDPKPKPPQPRDGYAVGFRPGILMSGTHGKGHSGPLVDQLLISQQQSPTSRILKALAAFVR